MEGRLIYFTVTNDLSYDQRMIRCCKTLAAAGYSIKLIGRRKPSSAPLSQLEFEQVRLNCRFQKGKLFYLEFNLRLFWFLLFQQAGLMVAVDLDTLWAVSGVAALRRLPTAYDAHEYFSEVPEVVGRPLIQKFWEWTARRLVPNVTFAYTVCESLADIFSQKYRKSFRCIRNVPFYKDTKSPPKVKPAILLYQGALNEGRGLTELLSAMPLIEGAELWLAGEGDCSDLLRKQVKNLQLENKVKFLGYVLPKELSEITRQATIGLNLLENKGLNYYYSLANKTFDYIMAEVPTIHMDFPEYRLLNEEYETAMLLENLAVETISSAICKLLEDESYRERLKANCQKAKAVLNWERESEKLLALYQKNYPL